MEFNIRNIAVIILVCFSSINYSQEWRNIKSYQKETGLTSLQEGCWLKKDRKKQNNLWQQANLFNLSIENGNQKYRTIRQIRDFYYWFDSERLKQGHEIHWAGIAAIASSQLSKLEIGLVRCLIVRNPEVIKFAHEGSTTVFEFSFPLLRKVYFSQEILIGEKAKNWDIEYGQNEQCLVLDSLYKQLSPKALTKLDRMAKGKGIYFLAVPKKLKYDGNIGNCHDRFNHGINKILDYYLETHKNTPPNRF
ncbi:hypothetical protein SLW70_14815 [Flavobacterium sp. NG2]|uniref:hypothetical protein n=1 Tax=Flavobacterium sp. NG2 TaxID=3097547 RepID=UPI002A81173D|nr:hypothetical protein [Flavobacterium sp. NG2]WPR71194.1 hypothetical protein SLW70_14815 [Flavobacterium sp. NG2]